MDFNEYVNQKKAEVAWEKYCTLMKNRPHNFKPAEELMIETDITKICGFELEKNRKIGVIYESPYNMLIVDLVYGASGEYFCYERILPTVESGAILTIPFYQNQYILLNQFRHALRGYQFAFPRGYGEQGVSADENIKKELKEELGAEVIHYEYIGEIAADSGLSGNIVDVYCCEITCPQIMKGHEGIKNYIVLNKSELLEMVRTKKINDGFTLAAISLYTNR